jgi:hypothetical protein
MKSEIRSLSVRPRFPRRDSRLASRRLSAYLRKSGLQVATDSYRDRAEPRYKFVKNCRQ